MLELVKKALRISNTAFDDEVTELIESAKSDLRLAGVHFEDETDPLIIQAVKTYAKANFGYENTEADRFQDSYVMLKQHLCLAGEYKDGTMV